MFSFQRFATTLAVLELLALSFDLPAANALPVSFVAKGANVSNFDGEVSAKTIGGIMLPKGSVTITDRIIEVNAVPEWLFDKHVVLSGVIINSQLKTVGNTQSVSGLAYFNRGDWLRNLGRTQASETVSTADNTYMGHIGAFSETSLELMLNDGTRKSIPLTDVTGISSTRAYSFDIPTSSIKIDPTTNSYQAEGQTIAFHPVMFNTGISLFAKKPSVPKSDLPGTEGGISNKAIFAFAANDIAVLTIAPIVSLPIVFTRSTLHARQLLFINGNQSVGSPLFEPQFYNGAFHYFPTH